MGSLQYIGSLFRVDEPVPDDSEIPELQAFMRLETKYELEKRAFIFACLCGLRSSDIRQLTWDTFIYTKEGVSVSITMEKTEKPCIFPSQTMP